MLLHPHDPPARSAAILADARPAALLSEAPPAGAGIAHLALGTALAGPDAAGWQPERPHDPDAPAVVHFTSGSTGAPKGIVLPMRAVLFRTLSAMSGMDVRPGDAVLATTLPAMGSGLSFLLAALLGGARYLAVDLAREGATAVLARGAPATVAAIGPPILRTLCRLSGARAAFAGLRRLRIGAAGLAQADLDLFRATMPPGCVISHTYASTEALIAAEWVVPPDYRAAGSALPVGVPVGDHDFLLLGPDGQAVAPGEAGEYVARSRHMAIGEWRDGALVEGRMRPDPLVPGRRIFHTGDLLRLEPDGMLHFVGRLDRQVKINGVRIEPREAEAVLRAAEGVVDAAVVAVEGARGVSLHGFVAAPDRDAAVLRAELQGLLRARLPAALRPARLTVLPALPAMPGGKTDIKALLALAGG